MRTAVNAVRSLAGLSSATWTNATLTAQSSVISADDVRDLRTNLDDALTTLGIQTSSYTDSTLATGASGTAVKKVHITELRQRVTSGAGNSTSGGSNGGLMYVLTDVQGSTRAVMNNNGSSSVVVARHDYLPFGEEIGAGLGLRSSGQGYNASDTNRRKYGLTERDNSTGLDHTWWRKYESFSGRWTSPDPYRGSMTIANPQSFNQYSYVGNDPTNFVDPMGLFCVITGYRYEDYEYTKPDGTPGIGTRVYAKVECYLEDQPISPARGGGESGRGGGFGGNPLIPGRRPPPTPQKPTVQAQFDKVKNACLAREKAKADRARSEYRNRYSSRLFWSMGTGALVGAGRGGYAGAVGGEFLEPLGGGVPGAIVGGVVGGIFGAASGVLTSVVKEPIYRAAYDRFFYNPALDFAHLDCDAEARTAVATAQMGGRR